MQKLKSNAFRILLVASPMIFGVSCANHDLGELQTVQCDGFETVSFQNDIQPIITNHCALEGCHNGDNGDDKNWTQPEKFKAKANEAKRRVQLPEGNPDHMPAAGEISAAQIQLIVCWAEQGAPINN